MDFKRVGARTSKKKIFAPQSFLGHFEIKISISQNNHASLFIVQFFVINTIIISIYIVTRIFMM